MSEHARILLIEDDPQLGALLREELVGAGYAATWAVDAKSGLESFRQKRPDLVLCDLMLPDRSGFAVVAEIRREAETPILILTARTGTEDKVQGLDLGADDYITKPFWSEELLARIRARLRRPGVETPKRIEFGDVVVDVLARTVDVAGEREHFTPVEFDLLVYLVERPDRTVLRDTLVAEVRGEDLSEVALHSHLSRIRRKLRRDGDRIHTIWGLGYRFDTRVADEK